MVTQFEVITLEKESGQVSDFFACEDEVYLITKTVEGESLEGLVKREGIMEEGKIITLMREILRILDYLHNEEPVILYGEISPSNVIISSDGKANLKSVDLDKTYKVGSPYAPVEQVSGMAETRSDIYSLGAAIYFALTGKEPSSIDFKPLREFNSKVSPELERIISKSLKLKASERFSSALDMQEELDCPDNRHRVNSE